jgi:hypothetical protein
MARTKTKGQLSNEVVISKIYLVRGQRVMVDKDLAELYEVDTRVLNQAVRRNKERFPNDFMFQMNAKEFENWKSQIVISNSERMGLRKRPLVFTEQGVAMLSSVLNSKTAINVNIQIIRVFTRMRELMLKNKDILLQVRKMEKKLDKHDDQIMIIFAHLKKLLTPPEAPRRKIGFRRKDEQD